MSRSGAKRRRTSSRGSKKAIGAIITLLLLVSVGICLFVVFFPMGSRAASSAVSSGDGKTIYLLATAEEDDRETALLQALSASERGGAGFLYNDGKYHTVAAAYERESDVKTLVTVNADSHYFSITFGGGEHKKGDQKLLDYFFGEWFSVMSRAASELERGNITESSAERAAFEACNTLCRYAYAAESESLRRAVTSCGFSPPPSRSLLSYIRYIHVQIIFAVYYAVN